MKHTLSLLLIASFALAASPAMADSLYPISSGQGAGTLNSLFADTKAHNVGDILTIVVTETATGSSAANTKIAKSDNGSFGAGVGPLLEWIKLNSLTGSINSSTGNSTDRTDSLSATIAVMVKEVLPNGNLMVEGDRSVGINAETQHITLTGIVRPQDIGANNQVSSQLVSNAQIHFAGKGPVGDTQHYGIITRIFHYLF
ncbi:MAG TPA: flagellar basal body L-ring protein FlgH [Capsulimonadaceae bacterium]|nr:flagellar basal body L-ring protein FlgH [Capsulimonadaceae bacterium]